MSEKKTATVSLSLSATLKQKLLGLAEMEGISVSEYMDRLVVAHVVEKEAEARILAEALGLQINDI